jgi:acetylornithine/succinyldiaminopimelate/putrescine aminotransferase
LAAFVSSNKIMQVLQHNPVLGHITTFGGNAICCAAGLASLQEIIAQKLAEQVEEKSQLFLKLLQHHAINKINYCGLMMAVYLDSFDNLQKVIQECLANGLVTDWFLFANNCMRIAPPLIISQEEIKQACVIILKSLDKVYGLS